jgi:glyoxylase-like metal-dependent hydrolase (beta-lactamase superfamily II)/rhodanese-related sulfurtransferase
MQESIHFISPREVKELLRKNGSNFTIIDIRDEDEFNDWNIKGSINIPVNKHIVEGNAEAIKSAFKHLKRHKSYITTCARGINSQLAASILTEMGYNAYVLTKGLKGWNENFDFYEISLNSNINNPFSIVQFVRIGKGCLSYIIIDENSKESAIIDPSVFIDEYINYINMREVDMKYIIDTHAHADHFSGGMALEKTLGVNYNINKIDVDSGVEVNDIGNINDIMLGELKISIHSTPGHTDGSLSFLIGGKALMCGDLMLLENMGRPDLARNKAESIKGAEKLFETLNNFILKLDDYVKVFPAHFVSTELRPVTLTIKELKQQNEALSIKDKKKFIEYITGSIPNTPPNYETIKKFNKSATIIPVDYAEDLEIGPNRCAAK